MKKKTQPKRPRLAIVVTWQPLAAKAEYGFVQAFTENEFEDLGELAHIGGRCILVASGARVGQRVKLEEKAAA